VDSRIAAVTAARKSFVRFIMSFALEPSNRDRSHPWYRAYDPRAEAQQDTRGNKAVELSSFFASYTNRRFPGTLGLWRSRIVLEFRLPVGPVFRSSH
jgi:hypothetical protein